ncbi:hypothetical protein P278_29840 [Zhouia amylolytica AD3]|uniref:Uncharacterized protein n=1 Tax=Zhouia amylolytica AD3 TaxID=1286632 RepID=W2UJ50_9FLAO|nr:hypothetical protein P278_29840 [Zhouia amylolytica AD3]
MVSFIKLLVMMESNTLPFAVIVLMGISIIIFTLDVLSVGM